MSIIHRAVAGSLQHRAPLSSPQVEGKAAAPTAGQFTCLPWVGLCFEGGEPATTADSEVSPTVSKELDAFLLSLMYGE